MVFKKVHGPKASKCGFQKSLAMHNRTKTTITQIRRSSFLVALLQSRRADDSSAETQLQQENVWESSNLLR